MNAGAVVERVIQRLERLYGSPRQIGRSRLIQFGNFLTCSINYSRLLGGHKYFFGVSQQVADPQHQFPATVYGEFTILVCGAAEQLIVLPRSLTLQMLGGVSTRRIDVFVENGSFVLQTTKHPKLDVTQFLNVLPKPPDKPARTGAHSAFASGIDRAHIKYQWSLIRLGRAEGCSVWVPPNDQCLSYNTHVFSEHTLPRLPNFGFDETTRRIVQNVDVLWLNRNVITKAFEVESTTTIYSGLLRLNDLTLAQPNNNINLYIAAHRSRRAQTFGQLSRPSFRPLLSKCRFLAFEDIDVSAQSLDSFPISSGARVTGLIQGERFELLQQHIYPIEP